MTQSINQLSDMIARFEKERGWDTATPTQTFASIVIELAELGEYYQWEHDYTRILNADAATKKQIGFEFVDVLIYLLSLSHRSGIDIQAAFDEKMPLLAQKYRAGATDEEHIQAHKEYRKSGKSKQYEADNH